MTATVKIGLIGCGRWGRYILRDLKSLGAEVLVVETSESSIHNAIENGADAICRTLDDLPENIDGFVVATPTISHFTVVKQLLLRKRPIIVEKPFSICLDEVDQILRHDDQKVYVMHKWRYHPGIARIQEIIKKGTLGKVLHIQSIRNQWGMPHKDVDTVWIHFPHDLSIIWHLLQDIPEPCFARYIKDNKGIIRGLTAHLGKEIKVTIEHNCLSLKKERKLWVHFENGVIQMNDPLSDHLLLAHGYPESEIPLKSLPISQEMPLLLELKAFLDYITTQTLPLWTPLSEEKIILNKLHEIRHLAHITD